jgi:hypothetical protein
MQIGTKELTMLQEAPDVLRDHDRNILNRDPSVVLDATRTTLNPTDPGYD